MESETLRKWLAERGCHFERHERAKGGLGHAVVTVRLGERSAELPGVGTKQRLDPDQVRAIVDALGLNASELPGPASRT